jgi:uncharacterized protein YceH (UPF0502 family)
MLRGPQTPGELKQRGQRLHDFADLAAVQDTLDRLVERGHVARHPRRPGQKEDRYEQLVGGGSAEAPDSSVESVSAGPEVETQPAPEIKPAEDRLTRLEREVGELRSELDFLRSQLGD